MTAAWVQVAMQQADYVAWNLWASINGRTLLPFKYQHLGTMLTFGRGSGALKLNVPLPSRAPPPPLPAAPTAAAHQHPRFRSPGPPLPLVGTQVSTADGFLPVCGTPRHQLSSVVPARW